MAVQIQIRHGLAADWTTINPTLAVGEMGVETDTGRFKIGNGSSTWTALNYSLGVASKGPYSGSTQYYPNDIVSLSGSSYICIAATLGNSPPNATYWNILAAAGTVSSVGQTFTGGIVSVSGSPVTSSGTLALTVAGTSGGVPYFSSGTTWASSAALASNALVVGGGAGAAPSTVTTGTGVVTALGVNTGSAGAFVVNGGALGTPSSGTLTNATGLPVSTGVSGLGTGVATFLGTPSSANLAAAVTDETGSGSLVFGTNATLTNPTVTNYVETLYSANTSTAITVDLANGTVQNLTLTAASVTITMPTAVAGKSFIIILSQDATGSRSVTWSTVSWPSATPPSVTQTASRKDIFSFFSNGTSWFGTTIGQNYT